MKLLTLALIALQCSACDGFETETQMPNAKKIAGTNVRSVATNVELPRDSSLLILTYGLPVSGAPAMARRDIAEKFGFKYYAVAGCVVTEQLLDSVKTENDRTYQTISQVHGNDWQQSFEKQVTALSKKYAIAIKLAEKDARIKSKTEVLSKKDEFLSLDASPGSSENLVDIEAYSFRWSADKNQKIVYLRLEVDLRNSTITLKDETEKVYEL